MQAKLPIEERIAKLARFSGIHPVLMLRKQAQQERFACSITPLSDSGSPPIHRTNYLWSCVHVELPV